MSQPYNYARQYKILNPTDDYTHIMIEAGFIDGDYSGYQKTVLDANMRDEIFKKRNSSELALLFCSILGDFIKGEMIYG